MAVTLMFYLFSLAGIPAQGTMALKRDLVLAEKLTPRNEHAETKHHAKHTKSEVRSGVGTRGPHHHRRPHHHPAPKASEARAANTSRHEEISSHSFPYPTTNGSFPYDYPNSSGYYTQSQNSSAYPTNAQSLNGSAYPANGTYPSQYAFPGQVSYPRGFPRHGHVAVILRGQSFRPFTRQHNFSYCEPDSVQIQIETTQSFMKYVVAPLERAGNQVYMYIADAPCKFHDMYLNSIYEPDKRFVVKKFFEAKDQADGYMQTLDFFMEQNYQDAKVFDQVVITRHDIMFKQEVYNPKVLDCSKLNFAAPCEQGQQESCANDVLHMMPGSLFSTFYQVKCFLHQCVTRNMNALRLVGANLGFILWDTPGPKVRHCNDWYAIYSHPHC